MNRYFFTIFVLGLIIQAPALASTIKLVPLSQYKSGPYDQGAAEVVSYDPIKQRIFVVNGAATTIDVLSVSDPANLTLIMQLKLAEFGAPNSVAVHDNLLAVAVASKPKQADGKVILFNTDGHYLAQFQVGPLPDMVTFTPDGKYLLTANEGEPSDDYLIDPEGSVSIITLPSATEAYDQAVIQTAHFRHFNDEDIDDRIRVFGKGASVAQDLEPEYITVAEDSSTAWVALQENNAIAVLDIQKATFTALLPLGTQSHAEPNHGIDASDEDRKINIRAWPVEGMYQPDTIANYVVNGQTYIVTANEGDGRDYPGYSEETRVAKMTLSDALTGAAPSISKNRHLGRLKVSTVGADSNGDGKADKLYSFGTRSFSIWTADGNRVFDSGSEFAEITARLYPALFNDDDDRSDNKGAEPEALAIGKIGEHTYAFIGLERTGGVMVYDITTPTSAHFIDYLNTRNANVEDDDPRAGDIAPESIVFVSAEQSVSGKPFIVTANEVSGTVAIYGISTTEPTTKP